MYPDSSYPHAELATGADVLQERCKYITVPYQNFEIVLCLSGDDRFLGVAELRIRKDFLSPEQRIANTGVFDVDEFYRE